MNPKLLHDVMNALLADQREKTLWLQQTYGYSISEIKEALLEILNRCEIELRKLEQ